MNVKKFILLFLILMLPLSTTSCSSGNKEEQEGNGQLSIYIMEYDTNTKNAIAKFNETHKGTSIKETTFLTTQQDSMKGKLTFELTRGQGPDIILCDTDTLPNLSVYFDKGSFCDLNELINNNKSIKLSDYFEKVLDFGVYNGKRYVIPLSFDIDSMFTTKDTLAKHKIDINPQEVTINKLSNAVQAYMQESKSTDRYFFSGLNFNTILQTVKIPFIDLENKKASFDSVEFINLLKQYKELLVSVYSQDNSREKANNIFDTNVLLTMDKIAVLNTPVIQLRYITEAYAGFKSEVEPEIYPSVSADDVSHVIAKPEMIIGINSKCKNKKAALDFLKLLLSKEYQDTEFMQGIPVNREAYVQEKDSCLKGKKGYDSWSKGGIRTEAALKKLFTQLDKLIDNIDRCEITDGYILSLINDEMQNYLQGTRKAEDTAKSIQQKVEDYIKSGFVPSIENVKPKETEAKKSPNSVSVCYNDMFMYVKNSIRVYNDKYPDAKLDEKEISIYSFDEYKMNIATEIMAGGGSDIVFFWPDFFNSISKTVSNGAFCDLNELIEKDKEFNTEDYYMKILDTGVYDGKRYYIPLNCYFTPFLTTRNTLETYKINIDESDWTWGRLAEYAKEFMQDSKNKGKYFLLSNIDFSDIIRSCEYPFVDYKNRKSKFNSNEFKELLRVYKDIYPSMGEPGHIRLMEIIKSGKYILLPRATLGNPLDLQEKSSGIISDLKDELVMLPMPVFDKGKRVFVKPIDSVAINSKCKNKNAAFNFIKILLSSGIQQCYDSYGHVNQAYLTAVSRKAYKADLDYFQKALIPLPYNLARKAEDLMDIAESSPIKDEQVYKIIDEAVKGYIEDIKNEDQVSREIDDKVTLFLNE